MKPAVTSRLRRLLLPALVALLLPGCAGPVALDDPARVGPFYQPANTVGVPVLPATVRRVVLLPLAAGDFTPPETAAEIDRLLLVALQKQARFEVVALSREDSLRWFGEAEHSSAGALPHDYLKVIANRCAADAVIFVDLTAYRAYRPLELGLRAKLVTTGDVQILWSFDEVISAGNQAVANSARRRFLGSDDGSQPIDLSHAVLQNPSRFATYAAEAMFQTLPAR